jgi:hypothetical protein
MAYPGLIIIISQASSLIRQRVHQVRLPFLKLLAWLTAPP